MSSFILGGSLTMVVSLQFDPICVCVCVCGHVLVPLYVAICTKVWVLMEARGVRSPGAGVTGSYQLPAMGSWETEFGFEASLV